MDDIFDKISKLMEKNKEDFEIAFFPSSESMLDFEKLVSVIQEKLDIYNAHESEKQAIELVKQFFEKLKHDQKFDVIHDTLHKDRFHLTKKVDQGSGAFDGFVENWENGDRSIPIEKLCHAYAYSFERFCKLYLRPLANKISNQNINKCGKALEIIIDFYPDIKPILKHVIPQIRNSIDHVDYFYDKTKDKIIFIDEKKPPIELDYEEMKLYIHWIMNEEMYFSCAIDEMKMPLYKSIISDTKKVKKYCEILSIDFDKLLNYYLKKGKSIFEIAWSLEQIINNKI